MMELLSKQFLKFDESIDISEPIALQKSSVEDFSTNSVVTYAMTKTYI